MSRRAPVLVHLGRAAMRRPRATLALWAAVAVAAGLAATRLHPSGSLESVLTGGEAARALARIEQGFGVVGDLIVLVSAEEAGADAEARLSRYAERLEAEIRRRPALSAMYTNVTARRMPEMAAFIREQIVPSARLLVDDTSLDQIRERLSTEGIREQIRRNEELISAPGGAGQGLAKAILRDPLRLHELLIPALAERFPAVNPQDPEQLFLSRDGRTLMIRVSGARPASDLPFAGRLTAEVSKACAEIDADGLTVELTGAYAIAVTAERSIRRDLIATMSGSASLLFLAFIVVYRRAAEFLLAMVPAGIGIVCAFGISGLLFPELTPVAAAIGAVLIGLSDDYSIHFLSHFAQERKETPDRRGAVDAALAHVGAPMAAAWLTSAVGFAAIAQSSVPALRQFAWMGVIGLTVALLATVTLLPAILCLTADRARAVAPGRRLLGGFEPLIRWVSTHPRRCLLPMGLIGVVVAVSAVSSPDGLIRLEHDLTVMHPRPNRPLELQHTLPERFGFDPDALLIHLRAAGADELLRLSHRVDRAMRSAAVRDTGVVGTFGPASLFPDPDALASRRAALRTLDAERIIGDFRAAVEASLFDPAAFAGYSEFLRRFLTVESAPTWDTLAAYPAVARLVLPRAALSSPGETTEALAVAFADRARTQRDSRDAAIEAARNSLAGIDGATLTGVSVLAYDTEHRLHHDLARQLGVALLLVVGYLVVHFRSVVSAGLALLPTLFGLLCLAEMAHVLDLRLNMVNLIGAPILIGIGVHGGIFVVSIAREARRAGHSRAQLAGALSVGCEAVLMSTTTTVLSLGTLAFASTPAIQSLGVMLTAAMSMTVVGMVFVLVPVVALLHSARTT